MVCHTKIKKKEKHLNFFKKGSGVLDIYYIFIFFFTSIFVVALALLVLGNVNTGLQESSGIAQGAKDSSNAFNNLFRNIADGSIIFWFAVLWIGSLASAFFLDNSPIYFVIFFLLSLGSYFVLIPFANIQYELSLTDALSSMYDLLPMAMFINNNMIYFITAYIISIGLALYIKFRVIQQ